MSQIRTDSLVPSGGIPGGAAGGGIIQVVTATKTDTLSTTSTSFTDVTGLSVTITPRKTSSKILIIASVVSGAQVRDARYRLMRDSTAIAIGDAAGSRERVTFQGGSNHDASSDTYVSRSVGSHFIDSPGTTSATTYKVQISTTNAAWTAYVNRSRNDTDTTASDTQGHRCISSITVMEVSG